MQRTRRPFRVVLQPADAVFGFVTGDVPVPNDKRQPEGLVDPVSDCHGLNVLRRQPGNTVSNRNMVSTGTHDSSAHASGTLGVPRDVRSFTSPRRARRRNGGMANVPRRNTYGPNERRTGSGRRGIACRDPRVGLSDASRDVDPAAAGRPTAAAADVL